MSKNKFSRGDTLVEVVFAITVFSLVSVVSLNLMDKGLALVQGSLELTMTRNEIDAQAEAIRYIHNSFLSERELVRNKSSSDELWQEYKKLWRRLTDVDNGLDNDPRTVSIYPSTSCSVYYNGSTTNDPGTVHQIKADKAFIINTRSIDEKDPEGTIISSNNPTTGTIFKETQLYPRMIFSKSKKSDGKDNVGETTAEDKNSFSLMDEDVASTDDTVYDTVYSVEGLWVIATRDITGVPDGGKLDDYIPQFFDFHIRSCWYSPGKDVPTTIATIIRLYNPEYVEKEK